jgi:hypothetical protein
MNINRVSFYSDPKYLPQIFVSIAVVSKVLKEFDVYNVRLVP